jgi:hypothetical protein
MTTKPLLQKILKGILPIVDEENIAMRGCELLNLKRTMYK